MAKKKGKGKGKGKKKGKGEKKTKGPSEKYLFMAKIQELEEQLGLEQENLDQHRKELETWKTKWKDEVNHKEACVSYLKRFLQKKTEDCTQVHDRLQMEKDMGELIEQRAMGQFANADRNREVMRSLFLQQKLELEGKISLLEELRLTRNSQRANLKRLEEALHAKNSALREKTREEDMTQVNRLLRNREKFRRMAGAARTQWKEVFDLRLPVYAKNQLNENVRLRSVCRGATQALLEAQDRSRELKKLEQSLAFENEIQTFAEEKLKSRASQHESRMESLRAETANLVRPPDKSEQVIDLDAQMLHIRETEVALSRIESELRDIQEILDDQARYKKSLQDEIDKNIDRNGLVISAILRAGKIFKAKGSKLGEEDAKESDMDFDVLQQIRMLLDVAESCQRRG